MSRDKGNSFLRVQSIIDCVIEEDRPITSTDISRLVDLPKATVHRLCQMLLSEGYLKREIDGKHLAPGPLLSRMALNILSTSAHRAVRQAILKATADKIGETCNISLPDGAEMIYFDRVESDWPLRIQLPVGSHVPLHCTASGKLYLSTLSAAKRRKIIDEIPLHAHTKASITDKDILEANLKQIRAQGFSIDNEEFLEGMVAVSVPVRDTSGRVCAFLATHGPSSRMTVEQAKKHVLTLQEAGEKFSQLIAEAMPSED